jgi:hypothetical protein
VRRESGGLDSPLLIIGKSVSRVFNIGKCFLAFNFSVASLAVVAIVLVKIPII